MTQSCPQLTQARCRLEMNSDPEPWPCEKFLEKARDCVGVVAFMTDCIDRNFLSHCPDLRIIASVLKGYDNFDVDACTRRGVWLTILPDQLTAPTAELIIGLMIALGRNILPDDRLVRRGE